MTVRTRVELSDGRELFYFDTEPGHGRDRYPDRRPAAARPPRAQLRFDPLRDDWVTVAAARQTRPLLPDTRSCPLCPSGGDRFTEIPAPDYQVAVFENRFPSFAGAPAPVDPDALFPRRTAAGRCEVVCFTADHHSRFADLTVDRARLVLDALADRTAALSRLDGVRQVFCFENRGEEIGVTLHHPHGQIYAYPYVTPVTRTALSAVARHRARHGEDLYTAVLTAERAGERVVAGNEHWTAFVPAAARWPFEVHLYPHRRFPDLAALPDDHRDSFVAVQLAVLRGLDAIFGVAMPYVAGWHQAPLDDSRPLGYLHHELFSIRRAPDRLKHPAGSESAMGAFVNDVTPETAARLWRDAIATTATREDM